MSFPRGNKMKSHVLITNTMVKSCEPHLEELYTLHRLYEQSDPGMFLAKNGDLFTAIAGADVSEKMMEQMPNLKMISSFGVGYDSIDVVAAKRRGIYVTNTPNVLNDAMAEITIGLMIALSRNLVLADKYVRAGKWQENNFPLQSELTGKTVGIVGLGRIGKEIALRAQAMKMRVIYCGRTKQVGQPYAYYSDVRDLAQNSDWLIIITTGGEATSHLINADVIKALGPKGYLVNMARGSVVDQDALIWALQKDELAGAALDVFADEPHVPDALLAMDKVILSPHQGSATHQTRAAMGALVVANLQAFFAGEPLLTRVV